MIVIQDSEMNRDLGDRNLSYEYEMFHQYSSAGRGDICAIVINVSAVYCVNINGKSLHITFTGSCPTPTVEDNIYLYIVKLFVHIIVMIMSTFILLLKVISEHIPLHNLLPEKRSNGIMS